MERGADQNAADLDIGGTRADPCGGISAAGLPGEEHSGPGNAPTVEFRTFAGLVPVGHDDHLIGG